ncbi:MAG TPA: biliverdin-producing heme oxygenase [Phycisphaerales bacterium]|nr:biliverdin-producing heme oxygenase [Phycisphaerales bacterium]
MGFADTLKTSTADAHRHAETRDLQRMLIRGALDDERLAMYLLQLRMIHERLERLLDQNPAIAARIGWSDDSRHSRCLAADVASLAGAAAGAPCAATARLLDEIEAGVSREPASLLGFVYVLEGSMNGNRFIVRSLRQTPAAQRCAFSYFDPYGDEQPRRWAAFKAALEAAGEHFDAPQRQAGVEAALAMFGAISRISDEVFAPETPLAAKR